LAALDAGGDDDVGGPGPAPASSLGIGSLKGRER
jgi:hypothetical protein